MATPTESTDDPRPVPTTWGPASGVGSLPGTDPAEAVRLVVGELPGFAHLPELPGRGAGADLIGRSAALLVDLAVDLTPAGWRLVPRSGVDQRRAREFLARDLDALYEVAGGYEGPLKVQAAGPWTLAAGLERTRGDRAVVDPGARRDLAQSLAEGVAAHAAAVASRVPGATVTVQLDEPSVPAVLQGGLPSASGFGKLSAVEASVVEQELAGLVQDLDAVGTAIEAGVHLFPGVVPGTDSSLSSPKATASRVHAWWRELGFAVEQLSAAVTLTPSCGLAGASPSYARAAMAHVREAAKYLQPD